MNSLENLHDTQKSISSSDYRISHWQDDTATLGEQLNFNIVGPNGNWKTEEQAVSLNQETLKILEINQPKTIEQLYIDVAKAVDRKGPFRENEPNFPELEWLLPKISINERHEIEARYDKEHKKPMLDTIKDSAVSYEYMEMKGLLMESDTKASITAVALHNNLTYLEDSSKSIKDTGNPVPIFTSMIGMAFAYGIAEGRADAFAQIAKSNDAIAIGAANFPAADVEELKAEHARIYGTDLVQLVRNTDGLSQPAHDSLTKLGLLN